MSNSPLSLTKNQISNVEQTIIDLKTENVEYMNTMKKLIDSTQEVNLANKKLEQGIQLHRDYLLKLTEKAAKGPKLIERSKLLYQQAFHRLKKYQKQISNQTKDGSFNKIRNEIDKLMNEIGEIHKTTDNYKQKIENEKETVNEINKLNGLKHELVKINQSLTSKAEKLLDSLSKIQMSSEIEKNAKKLKKKMLKSEEIRKKLETEDPNLNNSNSEVFTNIDDRFKQVAPIFDDLESLFLSSSSVVQSFKLSSEPISSICSELAVSDASKISQKSSARVEIDSSLKMTKSEFSQKNFLESSSSLNLFDGNIAKSDKGSLAKELDISSTIPRIVDILCDNHQKSKNQSLNSLSGDKNQQENTNNRGDKSENEKANQLKNSTNKAKSKSKKTDFSKESIKSDKDSDLHKNEIKGKNKKLELAELSSTNKKSESENKESKNPANEMSFQNETLGARSSSPIFRSHNKSKTNQGTKSEEPESSIKSNQQNDKSKSNKESGSNMNSEPQYSKLKFNKESKLKHKSINEDSDSDSNSHNAKPQLSDKSKLNKESKNIESESGVDPDSNIESKERKSKSKINYESEPSMKTKLRDNKSKSTSEFEIVNNKADLQNTDNNSNPKKYKKRKKVRTQLNQNLDNEENKSKSEDPEQKNSKKLSFSNQIVNLFNKSADTDMYLTSSSQEIYQPNQDKNAYPNDQNKNTKNHEKSPKSKEPIKAINENSTIDNDDNQSSNEFYSNNTSNSFLSKTQPRFNNHLAKIKLNKTESDSNIRNSLQVKLNSDGNKKRRRRRKSKTKNIEGDFSSSVLPDSKDEKNNKITDTSKADANIESESYSETMKANDNNDRPNNDSNKLSAIFNPIVGKLTSTNNDEKSINDDIVLKKKKAVQPGKIHKKEIDSDSDTYEPSLPIYNESKNNKQKNKGIRKRKAQKRATNSTIKKRYDHNDDDNFDDDHDNIDSDSNAYEPSPPVHRKPKNNKQKSKGINKEKAKKRPTNSSKANQDEYDDDNDINEYDDNNDINEDDDNNNNNDNSDKINNIQSGFNKIFNNAQLKKLDDASSPDDMYNDASETEGDLSTRKKHESGKGQNHNRVEIFDSNGNQLIGSIFIDENGFPLKNTQIFDKDGNTINKPLEFDENGNINSKEPIFDQFGNKINSLIKLNNEGEPLNTKIYDSKSNEIKNAFKMLLNNDKIEKDGNKNNKKREKDSKQSNKKENEQSKRPSQNLDDKLNEEEENYELASNNQSKTNNKISSKTQNPEKLIIFDSEKNQIQNPVLIDFKSGNPIFTELFDSNNQILQNPIEMNSDGKPRNNNIYDSNGQKVNCLISVDENGTPLTPKIYDENGKPINSLKSFIDGNNKKNKKKIKKKKPRLFDKDKNEIKNFLLIDSLGNPLNVSVFDSDGNEVKSSITLSQHLFDSNSNKIDSIIEVDKYMQPTNIKVYDSQGNEINDLSNFIPKPKVLFESSASLSDSNHVKLNDIKNKQNPKTKAKVRVKRVIVSIDENGKPIDSTLFDSDGNEIPVVEFDSNGTPKQHIYNQNKKLVTKIIIEDQDEIESVSSLSSEDNDDNLRRSQSDLNDIFCDANGNEFKNPIFVDLNDKPYNNILIYDDQGHLVKSPMKYDESSGVPEKPIFDSQGLPFSHVVQIGLDGNPTKFILYNLRMEPVTFPTLKIDKTKREKLEIVDDQENLNVISFETPEIVEEEESDEIKPKKSSQTKWTRSILSNVISSHLDKAKLKIAVADANVSLIYLEEDIHNLEIEKALLEMKVRSQIEKYNNFEKYEKKDKNVFAFNISEVRIDPDPQPNRYDLVRDVESQSEMTKETLNNLMSEIETNSDFLANNIVFEQQKMAADYHFPELEKLYFQVMKKNSRLKHTIDKLERHLNIVTSDNMAEYASKETRLRVRFEDSKKEKISIMSQTESSISDGYIQINDLNNKIEDQKMLIEILKKQLAEQQRKERPDAMKLCLELDGLRRIERKNRENLKMLEIEQNSIETQSTKLNELIDEKSMNSLQQSIEDSQKQLLDIKESFARMRKKSVKKANPLTNKYELMGLEEKIKEAKKQIADVKRRDSVAVNKIDKRIKILQSYGLRIPTHKRVSNDECI